MRIRLKWHRQAAPEPKRPSCGRSRVSPLGSMLRAQAIVGRRLLSVAWRRELGTLCSAGPEIGWQTGVGSAGALMLSLLSR